MKLADAINIRDKERQQLINRPFDNKRPDWIIRDVIVGTRSTAADIYTKMWDNNLTNETALKFFSIEADDFDVFVISHQWNWGSGDLLFESIASYRKANPSS